MQDKKKQKMMEIPLFSPLGIPFHSQVNQIKDFFNLPVPFIFSNVDQSGLMLELNLRSLVGATSIELHSNCGYIGSHPEMLKLAKHFELQKSHAPLVHDYELLYPEIDEQEQEKLQEMERLNRFGIQSVFKPWGRLSKMMEKVWKSGNYKQYLDSGLYCESVSNTPEWYSDVGFKFPLPSDEMFVEKDFDIPFDIYDYLAKIGGLEWLRKRGSATCPSKYQYIKKNLFVERKPRKAAEQPFCGCSDPPPGEQGCGESCLNRCMFIKCTTDCPVKNCSNQQFQPEDGVKGLQVVSFSGRGFGLASPTDIQKGSLIIEYRGEIISTASSLERMDTIYKAMRNHYFLSYGPHEVIDGHLKGTLARFINHSCQPNCHIEKWTVEGEFQIGVFASKDIKAGEELSYDYNFESFGQSQTCRCGAPACKGVIGTSRLEHKPKEKREKPEKVTVIREPVTESKSFYITDSPLKARRAKKVYIPKPKKQPVITQLVLKSRMFLLRNLASKPKNRCSMQQVIDRIGPKRIQGSKIFLMRNLYPKRVKRKSLNECLINTP